MAEEITILSLGDRDRWIAEHQEGGLPSQSWHYAWGLSASGVDPKLAIVRAGGARMLLPFVERDWMGSTEISTILGISGASILPNCGAPLRLWHQFAAAQGWVTGYVQLAMLTNLEGAGLAGQLIANNEAFLLDLETGFRFDRFARTIRRKIRQSEVEGVVLVNDRPVLADALKRL